LFVAFFENVTITDTNRNEKRVETMTIRGHSIRYVILPEQLALDNLLVDDTPKQGKFSYVLVFLIFRERQNFPFPFKKQKQKI
jgi:hypothetical protein